MFIRSLFNTPRASTVQFQTASRMANIIFQSRKYSAIINDDNAQRFASIAKRHLPDLNPYRDLEGFVKTASLAAHELPVELRSDLYDFKMHGNKEGYFLIRSLPTDDDLMATPKNLSDVPKLKKSFQSEFWLTTVGSLLGQPFGYIQENNGNLFNNVRPSGNKEHTLSAESSKVTLDLHSEVAFHPFYPDHLLLYCLREDRTKNAKTIVASIAKIKDRITPQLESLLRQPLYKTGIDYSFGNESETKGNGPVIPIMYGDPNDPLMIFDPDLMTGMTEDAEQAIKNLKEMLDNVTEGVEMRKGDLIVIDNYRALHGRTKFEANYDGQDRWLQRILVSSNLAAANKMFGMKERIITHKFTDLEG